MVPNKLATAEGGQKEVFFMANVMTKVQKFDAIAKALESVTLEGFDVQEFLANEIAQTNKRNARKSTAPSKTQKENVEIKNQILDILAGSTDGMTATEVANSLGLKSSQKATALLTQLVKDAKAVRNKTSKGVFFTLA